MATFQTVAKVLDISPGEMKLVDLDGEDVVITNFGGAFFAFNNTCPHKGGPLVEGELKGENVTCPWHATVFNIKSGEALAGAGTEPAPI